MRLDLPLSHLFLVRIMLVLSPGLCQLLWTFVQSMFKLPIRSNEVLRGGACVSANCEQNSTVVSGLGACLSELVIVPQASGISSVAPLPTITGINTPTPVVAQRSLQWWQILLMALGCAFIFLVFIWCCRRRARKLRAKKTTMFATTAGYGRMGKGGWRWRLMRFGEKLFGHKPNTRPDIIIRHHIPLEAEALKPLNHRSVEEVDGEQDLVQLIGDYNYPVPKSSYRDHITNKDRIAPEQRRSIGESSQLSAPSIYSQMTGMPNRTPVPRQPLRKKDLTSRFSASTLGTDEEHSMRTQKTKNSFWK
ncbi:hypothetical protein H0H93_006460 [Arthromyces matolae]|nr:hypothetical protein H0H93_006460 [Arthromyces matolae]